MIGHIIGCRVTVLLPHLLHAFILLLPTFLIVGLDELDRPTTCFAVGVLLAGALESMFIRLCSDMTKIGTQDDTALGMAQVVGLILLVDFWGAQVEHAIDANAWSFINTVGALLLIIGISLRVQAIRTLGDRFVSDIRLDGPLVKRGIYAWMSHPSEFGLLLIAVGAPMLIGSPLTAGMACMTLTPISVWRILRENRLLRPPSSGNEQRASPQFNWRLTVVAALIFSGSLAVLRAPLLGQSPKSTSSKANAGLSAFPRIEREWLAEPSALESGNEITLRLKNGKSISDTEFLEFGKGTKGELRSISAKERGKNRRINFPLGQVQQIATKENAFEIVQEPDKKHFLLIDLAKRRQSAAVRLGGQRLRHWPKLTDDEQQAATEREKGHLKNIQDKYPGHSFSLRETTYFLFLSDMPADQFAPYVSQLDKMYVELSKVFGVPQGTNLWNGKCMIVVFVEPIDFQRFEWDFYSIEAGGTVQGLCHQESDGRVLTACYRGSDPANFATILVHETSHGFLWRLDSNVHLPSWINEGIADWVAGVATSSKEVMRRQKVGTNRLLSTGSLGGSFFTGRIEPWQYGAASHMTDFMLTLDAARYREFILGIKEGFSWEESLDRAYGMTPVTLAQLYGHSLGIPNLQP